MMVLGFVFSVGFVLGALAIVAVEALAVVYLIFRLNRKVEQEKSKADATSSSVSAQQALAQLDPSYYNKQGNIWVLESGKIPKPLQLDKASKDQKRNKEILEVEPVKKYAKMKDHSLYLSESNGSHTEIPLKGCIIVAVSATDLSSRKWAKRFPIQVESKTSEIYHGNKTFHIFLETSWEKESWCKALRLASCVKEEKLKWFAKLSLEFHSYLRSIKTAYPSFMKPSFGFTVEPIDRSVKFDGSSSKVRQFLKKLAKKASKSGLENKAGWIFTSLDEKISEKSHSPQESSLAICMTKNGPTSKTSNPSVEENMGLSSLTSNNSGSSDQVSLMSEADSDDKMMGDEGTLCLNLLVSRFFFDFMSNSQMKTFIKARIQRTLSNMRIPSFVGDVTCIDVDTGNLPPYIHGMRVLPSHMSEVWAMEIDIEYSGGAALDVETGIEVRDLDFQEGLVGADMESESMGEMTPDDLEGFEHIQKQLKVAEGTVEGSEQKDAGDPKQDGIKGSKDSTQGSSQVSKWKSILHSVAKQVSQTRLSLSIRVASLRGTLRLYIKPPPSDQVWFGFTSMPDIDFNLESFVGEHKITNTHIAVFLVSRFKTAIRETLVLPNCESVSISWMLAEKDDWVPRVVAPFIWIKQEASSTTDEVPSSRTDESESKIEVNKASSSTSENKVNIRREVEASEPTSDSSEMCASPSGQMFTIRGNPLQELRTPLLKGNECQESPQSSPGEIAECQSPSLSVISMHERNLSAEEDDSRPKRLGTRARMLGLGKKVGERFEEKRRHIEEMSRHIVEKMRGPPN